MGRLTRHRIVVAGRLLALAVTVCALLAGASCEHGGTAQAPAPTTTTPAASPSPAPSAPDGGIRVVETGFTPWTFNGRHAVTYGIIVENTSATYRAAVVPVLIRLTDADGNPVKDRLRDPPGDMLRAIANIFPGQRMAIGTQTYLDGSAVAKLEVEIWDSFWVPADADFPLKPITATDIVPDRKQLKIDFTMESEYTDWFHRPVAQAILRDADGNIVGGAGYQAGVSLDPDDRLSGFVNVEFFPDSVDDTKTEIYVWPQ